MSQTSLCVATAIATVNWMKETLISCVRPNHHYFHSRVSRSSIYLIKYRSCRSNLCHGAFGVCSCRSHLNMVGIRKSFHVPGSGCRPWPLWALWESHILPPCLLSLPQKKSIFQADRGPWCFSQVHNRDENQMRVHSMS